MSHDCAADQAESRDQPEEKAKSRHRLDLGRHARPTALVLFAALVLITLATSAADVGAPIANAQLAGSATPTRTISPTGYPSTADSAQTPSATHTVSLGGPPSQATPAPSTTAGPDVCAGDEALSIVPQRPRAGNELFIVVSSARRHAYPRLAGTEKTTFVRERPGQLGTVWEWSVSPTWPGQHAYTFYVDGTIPCVEVSLPVDKPLATSTPRPQSLDSDNGSDNADNGDNSDNSSDNDSDNDGSNPPTPTLTATATPRP
jgi:hypothetical protein